jgi:hypothetical protein
LTSPANISAQATLAATHRDDFRALIQDYIWAMPGAIPISNTFTITIHQPGKLAWPTMQKNRTAIVQFSHDLM